MDTETTHAYLRAGNVVRDFRSSIITNDRPDFLSYYENRMLSAGAQFGGLATGTIMPCSPGVENYSIYGEYDGVNRSLKYTMKFSLRDRTKRAMVDLPSRQILHRSRDVALALRPLQYTELHHRLDRMKANSKYLSAITALFKPGELEELRDIFIDRTIEYLNFDYQYIQTYVKEHATSSTGTGARWGELAGIGPRYWYEIYEASKAFFDKISETRNRPMFFSVPYRLGMRARGNSLDRVPYTQDAVEGQIDRSRIVMFRAPMSMPGAFIPNKTGWYKAIFDDMASALNLSHKVHFPMIEGGQIYRVASDLLHRGYKHSAYDGGSWESVVGQVFTGTMDVFMTQIGAQSTLPSGIFGTSALGSMLAYVVASRHLMSNDDEAIILGDDMNIFARGERSGRSLGELVAYQADDSDVQFVLGVAYKWDHLKPRIVGLKLTTDRADKSIHVGIDETGLLLAHHEGKADERTQELWNGLYHGWFGTSPLLESIERTHAAEFRGGSEMIHKMAEEGYKDVSLEEAEGWQGAE